MKVDFKMASNKSMLLYYFGILQVFCFVLVKSELFNVNLETRTSGTDGAVRIKFIGTLGESTFQTLGDRAGFFSEPNLRKEVQITTTETVGAVLLVLITLIESPNKLSIDIGDVVVRDAGGQRQVTFAFDTPVFVGAPSVTRAAPSPDLENPIISSPAPVILKEGSVFQLKATVTRKGIVNNPIKYQWYKENPARSPVPVAVGTNEAVVKVNSVQSADAGSYFCVMALGESIQKTSAISLVVNYLQLNPVTVELSGSSFIQEGKPTKLTCSASSNLPNIIVSWNNGTQEVMTGNTRLMYDIPAIHRNQSGDYTCRAEVQGLEEVRNHTTNVKVIYLDDPTIRGHTIINNTLVLLANESSELICDSASNPPEHTYKFTEDRNDLSTAGSNKFIVKTGGGLYSCTVKNAFLTKTITFKIVAGTLVGPNGGSGGSTGGSTGVGGSNDDFWTTEMIIIVVMAIVFFLILILLIIVICMLLKRMGKDDKPDAPYKKQQKKDTEMTEQQDIFYRPETDFQNNYINDTLTSQRGPTLGDIQKMPNSRFSLSSEEYKSSNNDIPPAVVANGKQKVDKQDFLAPNEAYATVDKKKKHHHKHKDGRDKKRSKDGDRSRSRSRSRSRKQSEEPGESSNWSQANDSKIVENFNNVEYC